MSRSRSLVLSFQTGSFGAMSTKPKTTNARHDWKDGNHDVKLPCAPGVVTANCDTCTLEIGHLRVGCVRDPMHWVPNWGTITSLKAPSRSDRARPYQIGTSQIVFISSSLPQAPGVSPEASSVGDSFQDNPDSGFRAGHRQLLRFFRSRLESTHGHSQGKHPASLRPPKGCHASANDPRPEGWPPLGLSWGMSAPTRRQHMLCPCPPYNNPSVLRFETHLEGLSVQLGGLQPPSHQCSSKSAPGEGMRCKAVPPDTDLQDSARHRDGAPSSGTALWVLIGCWGASAAKLVTRRDVRRPIRWVHSAAM